MDRNQLVAILAAIIYSGADDNERTPGYTPDSAVQKARAILREAETPEKSEQQAA
jgi:hypothetical protein